MESYNSIVRALQKQKKNEIQLHDGVWPCFLHNSL